MLHIKSQTKKRYSSLISPVYSILTAHKLSQNNFLCMMKINNADGYFCGLQGLPLITRNKVVTSWCFREYAVQ